MNLKIAGIAVIIAILSMIAASIAISRMLVWQDRADQLTSYVRVSEDSTKFYKNQYGQVVSQKEIIELDLHNMKELREQLDEYTRHFTSLNKRLNNVESLLKTQATASKTFDMGVKDTVVVVNNIQTESWGFHNDDPYFSISGYVVAFPDSLRRVVATPKLNMNVYGAEFWTRKKILGIRIGRKLSSGYEITTDNPYVQIMDIQFIRKKIRK